MISYTASVTRGNSLKIVNKRCHYDLRTFSFCNRISNLWNSLPEDIVTVQYWGTRWPSGTVPDFAIVRSRVRLLPVAAVYQRQLSVPSLRGRY